MNSTFGIRVPDEWRVLKRGRETVDSHDIVEDGDGGVDVSSTPDPVHDLPASDTPQTLAPKKKRKAAKQNSGCTSKDEFRGAGKGRAEASHLELYGVEFRGAARPSPPPNNAVFSMEDACRNILDCINSTAAAKRGKELSSASTLQLNMDNILSRVVEYKDLLRNLFADEGITRPLIPLVTKKYEESFMREPIYADERQCVMGTECECNFISVNDPFVGVEFWLPDEHGHPSDGDNHVNGLCVLCNRKLTQSLFYDIVYSGKPYRGVVQKYGSICGVPGEYARDVMLICPPNAGFVECMPFPAVSHQRNKYTVIVHGGKRHIRQNNMEHKDFCTPPTTA